MTTSRPERIAIIGGGFCGVITAVNLARLSRRPLELILINAARPTGRGAAYGTRRMEHLLNVPARNMSAFPDIPDHFLQWLRTRSQYDLTPDRELRERFIPRMIYGDYIRGLMQQHLQGQGESALVQCTFVDDEAVDVAQADQHAVVHLAHGETVEADRVVLATGNEVPAGLPGSEKLENHPGWIANPWKSWEHRLPATGGTVILLGTGLTTVDAVITLRTLGWQGIVHAVSRNGWLPHSHFRGIEYPDFPPGDVDLPSLGLKKLVALMEQHCARLRDLNANPAIIVDKMRPYTQRVWAQLTVEERLEFSRTYAARWNIHRHRIAPEIYAQLTTAQLTGQLSVHAANIEQLLSEANQVRVNLSDGKALVGDLVINATGPHARLTATGSVLLQNLLKRGLAIPDDMDMGLRVDPDHTMIDADGRRSKSLLTLGPLLRGTLWETIAVPELRGQARRVAETLLDQTPSPSIGQGQIMMEYMI
jgi:uncharacterized NAD(P)/FAD-binding protein YdhS